MVVTEQIVLCVYNPRSGKGTSRIMQTVEHTLKQQNIAYQCVSISSPVEKLILESHPRCILLVGGDGTVNSIVSILVRNALDIPIAIIPRGTANLLAKSLGLPKKIETTIHAIRTMETMRIDIARLGSEHYIVGAFAAGYLSDRVTATTRTVKQRLGFAGYLWSFLTQTRLPLHTYSITIDGQPHDLLGHSLFVLNTSNVFGVHSRRTIDCQDGLFELVVTTNTKLISFVGLLIDFYLRKKNPRNFVLLRGKEMRIVTQENISMQIDGESLPYSDDIHISVLPLRQHIIIPRQ